MLQSRHNLWPSWYEGASSIIFHFMLGSGPSSFSYTCLDRALLFLRFLSLKEALWPLYLVLKFSVLPIYLCGGVSVFVAS